MTVTEIRQILESPYDRKVWKNFLQTQFTNNKLNAEVRTISLPNNSISSECLSLGFYEIDEYTRIGIFEIQLSKKINLARNRVQLRNLLKDITKQMAGAMVVFVQGDQWRFSYISKRKSLNKQTNLLEDKETAPKRYTYLFGKGEKALTAAQQFDKLIQKQKDNLFDLLSLEDFEKAFSVEKLGKDFFNSYKDIYEDFVEYITGYKFKKKGGKWQETKTHEPHFDFHDIFHGDAKAVRDFFKRMMGRIVFLYFIQKKGWLAVPRDKKWDEGNADYLFDLFNNAKYKELFYSDYLVPLFFETLNNPDSENEKNEIRFPYLNGGLFDKSQDFKYDKLALPSSIFAKLFNTFNEFNFTVYEDAPDEHTVAVDPEMLGHIFENLLEDNKDKGAFYTPKEIVHYMCKESLKAYLVAKEDLDAEENQVAQSALENIIQQQELTKEEQKYADKYAYKIIDALDHLKICDPAIGSGAFPMGLLQEIFNTQVYLQELKGFSKAKSDAEIKKHIIEESIYGVDIDEGAVDIARLRFWLSLVVDEPKPQPLPNLSFKIVCANSLIPLGKPKGDLGGTNEIADQIEAIREEYFNANKEAKKHLEMQFRNLQNKLWTSAKEWATGEDVEIYKKISEFNPFADKSCSWFDPWWMFGVEDGFDIVIGNPPYVNVEKVDKYIKDNIKQFKTAYQKYDLYVLFYELGINILKPSGILSFITSNKFLSQGYGLLLRKLFLENNINEIVNFNYDIFDNATVRTCIFNLQKVMPKKDHKIKIIDINSFSDSYKFQNREYTYINQSIFKTTENNNFRINLNDEKIKIIRLIENNSIKIEDIFSVNYGLRPSSEKLNLKKESFIYTENLKNHYKPYFEGKDMGYWLIAKSSFIDYQPDVMYNPMFPELFELPKLVGLRTLSDITKLRFIYDQDGYYCNDAVVVLSFWHQFKNINYQTVKRLISNEKIKTSKKFNYQFIQSILNSTLIKFYVNELMYDGTHFYPNHMKVLPIKFSPLIQQEFFSNIVGYLYFLIQHNESIFPHTENSRIASHFEDILNMMVCELYFEDHMKEVGLDVLQFVNPQFHSLAEEPLETQIKKFYEWYQKPDNAVRQRMMLVDTRSPDILAVINKSV